MSGQENCRKILLPCPFITLFVCIFFQSTQSFPHWFQRCTSHLFGRINNVKKEPKKSEVTLRHSPGNHVFFNLLSWCVCVCSCLRGGLISAATVAII